MLYKKNIFISILAFMTTLACFAGGVGNGKNSPVAEDQSVVQNSTVVDSASSWLDILVMILIILVIIFALYLVYVVCKWVYDKLLKFESELDYIKRQPRNQPQQTSSSCSRSDIENLRNLVNNVFNNQQIVIKNQEIIVNNNNANTENVQRNIEKIFQEVSTQGVQSQLTACLESINKLKEKVQEITGSKEDISNIAERLAAIKVEFNQLCEEQPSVIRFAIANAIELIQTCQETNLTQMENIRKAGEVWNVYK